MRQFTHDDIVLGYPDGWLDVSTVVLVGPPQGQFAPNIAIARERLQSPMKPAEYAAAQLPALKQEFGPLGYVVQKEGPLQLGDIPCFERFHGFMAEDSGLQLKQWQVYLVNGQDAVTITATDKAATFDNNWPLFRQAMSLLKVVRR